MSCSTDEVVGNKIIFARGNSHTVDVAVQKKSPTNKKKMIPVDLTGATAKLSVKLKITDTSYAVQLTGVVLTPPADGILEFQFDPIHTSALTPGIYVYDVRITLPGTKIYTVIKDALKLEETVTAP